MCRNEIYAEIHKKTAWIAEECRYRPCSRLFFQLNWNWEGNRFYKQFKYTKKDASRIYVQVNFFYQESSIHKNVPFHVDSASRKEKEKRIWCLFISICKLLLLLTVLQLCVLLFWYHDWIHGEWRTWRDSKLSIIKVRFFKIECDIDFCFLGADLGTNLAS